MFGFDLPKYAVLTVEQPNGGNVVMVHMGEGRFIAKVPPLAVGALVPPGGEPAKDPIPFRWDNGLAGDGYSAGALLFDAKGAGELINAQAANGDAFAIKVLTQCAEAEKMMIARDKLGVMQ